MTGRAFTAAGKRLVRLTGGPLDGLDVRVHLEPDTRDLRVPGSDGRYVENRIDGAWFWERDHR